LIGKRPDFKPNYIVPNLSSIIRCISGNKGIAVKPDFLSRKELESSHIKLLWGGNNIIENTLYLARRKKTIYDKELRMVEEVFEKEMTTVVSSNDGEND
ncbi:MAG: hypothetical protein LPK09_05400, partial [Hymenobacteraceae bacterium]|nr:hypothetical protein [Hymenobacteraceae bacterium]